MRIKNTKTKSNNNYSIIGDYTNVSGKRSTYVYETLGNDQKLIERFGKDNPLEKAKEYVKSLNQMIRDNKELPVILTLDPNKQIEKDEERTFFSGHIFLRKIYYTLGYDTIFKNISNKYKFNFDINSIVECLVFARIIWPSSKLSTFNQSKRFIGDYNFDLQHVYRTLQYLSKEIDNIQKDLFNYSKKVMKRDFRVVYYDCTNYFFYTEENDFQRYGISKQHQPLPLVQMGLFMDSDGYPIAMNINPGNTAESTTMIPEENKILKNYDLTNKNIVVCTDAAMCTDKIKQYNVRDGRGFIITQSIKKLKKELKEFALDKTGWRIIGNLKNIYDLSNVTEDFKQEHYNTIFYKEIECETKSVKQTLIVTFSFKYQEYQHNLKAHQFERAKILVNETNKKNEKAKKKKDIEKIKMAVNPNDPKRFIVQKALDKNGEQICDILYETDNEILEEEEKYNGLYGITTNLIDDISTIIKVIKGRWEIEESFRIMKNDFDSGTVHLSREDRIKGHFITCFLALFIYRYLEHNLENKYTSCEIIKQLQEMKLLEHKGKGYEPEYKRTDLTDALHAFLGENTDTEVISYKKMKKILDNQKNKELSTQKF